MQKKSPHAPPIVNSYPFFELLPTFLHSYPFFGFPIIILFQIETPSDDDLPPVSPQTPVYEDSEAVPVVTKKRTTTAATTTKTTPVPIRTTSTQKVLFYVEVVAEF